MSLIEAARRLTGWINRKIGFLRHKRRVVDRISGIVEAIPEWDRNAKEALTRYEPVAVESPNPIFVAHLHVCGMPVKFSTASKEFGPQLGITPTVGEIPLTRRDDLERLIALFVELHRVSDGTRFTDDVSGGGEQFDGSFLCSVTRSADQCLVCGATFVRNDPLGGLRQDAAVPADDGSSGQIQLAPPDDVGEITEGADHRDAGALFRIGKVMSHDRHVYSEEGCRNSCTE